MLVPMLKAIHKMLEGAKPEKVECARDVLGELIEHLEVKIPPGVIYHPDDDLDPEAQQAQQELTDGTV